MPIPRSPQSSLIGIEYFDEGFIEGYLDGVISKIGSLTATGRELSVAKVSCEEKDALASEMIFVDF